MKLVTLLLVLTVVLFVSVSVNAQRCQTVCLSDFNPVCGVTRRGRRTISCTFSNQCEFNKHVCLTRQRWSSTRGRCARPTRGQGVCPQNL